LFSQTNLTMNITINGRTFLVDSEDKDRYLLSKKSFIYLAESDTYPCYISTNKKPVFLTDFLFNPEQDRVLLKFSNGDFNDLRRCNVIKYHFYHDIVSQKYDVVEYIPGHCKTMGKDAHKMKNPMWRILEDEKEYLLMYCEVDTLCKLCFEGYNKILEFEKANNGEKLTWTYHKDAYVSNTDKKLHLHQVILDFYGQGKGTKNGSVDHIDRDKLNNTIQNLRIATQQEQLQNTTGIIPGTKRARNSTARALPDGITQDMMRKYVIYYAEDYAGCTPRQYFKVESPKLSKPWISSKSAAISILDKLAQANKVADDLMSGTMPSTPPREFPQYVTTSVQRGFPMLKFEKRKYITAEAKKIKAETGKDVASERWSLSFRLPDGEYDVEEQMRIMYIKLLEANPNQPKILEITNAWKKMFSW
jgi:HNH endonuclease